MVNILSKIFTDPNQREVGKYKLLVDEVNSLEGELEKKSAEEIKKSSLDLKEEITNKVNEIFAETESITDRKELNSKRKLAINEILNKHQAYAYALVREASKRTLGLRHYDVQIIGGAVLNKGQISEMKTGEGKTLVASLALYLNGLTGKGAHLITVNDYLARRDAGWMGPIYDYLGLTVGTIGQGYSYIYDPNHDNGESEWRLKNLKAVNRKEAYLADITYGTNNEFGFDYLRDNMAQNVEQLVQRTLTYAIVDEVDSILIDEARTPLIISSSSDKSAEYYDQFAQLIPKLSKENDYKVDEKEKNATLTDEGIKHLEKLIGIPNLYDPKNAELVYYAEQSLKAYTLFKKNRDYVVKEGEVIIVDEFTGRMLVGRRYSGGLHQAIEAKEKVNVQEESVTLATITFQNLFRLYIKLAGMTGTATTEAEEFSKIYTLEVVEIPTNRPNQRIDKQDLVYKNEKGKYDAVVNLIKELQAAGQPILIGTVSIAKSERLAKLLKAAGIQHNVLNAKHHQKEAEIIAKAGSTGAVTVATNMAGRGVDIVLGGEEPRKGTDEEIKKWEESHQKIMDLGGLFVIGTERHESRRIDNQLRGRSGRQGDPGISQFFVSMEDDLMRIFGGDRMKSVMERLNIPEDMAINNKLLSKAIEQAQSKVETHNFDIRKQLVEYDDVMNKHREAIYRRRNRILHIQTEEDVKQFHEEVLGYFNDEEQPMYIEKYSKWPDDAKANIEKIVALRAIDVLWVEHLKAMEDLREAIGLRGYAQKEPLVEYKQDSYQMFGGLQKAIDEEIKNMLLHLEVEPSAVIEEKTTPGPMIFSSAEGSVTETQNSASSKVGRNDPCPCGSGKKYKKCHGK